jgi:hypothetical protein
MKHQCTIDPRDNTLQAPDSWSFDWDTQKWTPAEQFLVGRLLEDFRTYQGPKGFRGKHPSFPLLSAEEVESNMRGTVSMYRNMYTGAETFDADALIRRLIKEYRRWLAEQNDETRPR